MQENMQTKQKEYALEYYLNKVIPKSGTVCVISPKKYLTSFLPRIAKEKKCSLFVINAQLDFLKTLLDNKVPYVCPSYLPEADVHLIEPQGITNGGILVSPNDAKVAQHNGLTAVVSASHWSSDSHPSLDMISAKNIVSELGILTQEKFEEEVSVVF